MADFPSLPETILIGRSPLRCRGGQVHVFGPSLGEVNPTFSRRKMDRSPIVPDRPGVLPTTILIAGKHNKSAEILAAERPENTEKTACSATTLRFFPGFCEFSGLLFFRSLFLIIASDAVGPQVSTGNPRFYQEGLSVMAKGATATAGKKAPTKSEVLNNISAATDVARKDVSAVLEALAGEVKKALGNRGPGVFAIPGPGQDHQEEGSRTSRQEERPEPL